MTPGLGTRPRPRSSSRPTTPARSSASASTRWPVRPAALAEASCITSGDPPWPWHRPAARAAAAWLLRPAGDPGGGGHPTASCRTGQHQDTGTRHPAVLDYDPASRDARVPDGRRSRAHTPHRDGAAMYGREAVETCRSGDDDDDDRCAASRRRRVPGWQQPPRAAGADGFGELLDGSLVRAAWIGVSSPASPERPAAAPLAYCSGFWQPGAAGGGPLLVVRRVLENVPLQSDGGGTRPWPAAW